MKKRILDINADRHLGLFMELSTEPVNRESCHICHLFLHRCLRLKRCYFSISWLPSFNRILYFPSSLSPKHPLTLFFPSPISPSYSNFFSYFSLIFPFPRCLPPLSPLAYSIAQQIIRGRALPNYITGWWVIGFPSNRIKIPCVGCLGQLEGKVTLYKTLGWGK